MVVFGFKFIEHMYYFAILTNEEAQSMDTVIDFAHGFPPLEII